MGANSRTIWEVASGYKHHLDRTDRMQIDAKKLFFLLHDEEFFNDIDKAREGLKIPHLQPRSDLLKPIIKLLKHRYGVNSRYLQELPLKKFTFIEFSIYTLILKKWKLSFNFYPFIEWYLLYKSVLPVNILPEPNPNFLELCFLYPGELSRTPNTASDRRYVDQMLKLNLDVIGYPPIKLKRLIDNIDRQMSLNKNTLRRPKDWKKFSNGFFQLSKHRMLRNEHKIVSTDPNHFITYRDLAQEVIDDQPNIDSLSEKEIEKLQIKYSAQISKMLKSIKNVRKTLKN